MPERQSTIFTLAGKVSELHGFAWPTGCRGLPCVIQGWRFPLPALQAPDGDAGWSSPVARQAHNLKVVGSNPAPATNLSKIHSLLQF